jgi:glycosyltransferase involved in cell wall biosynthesis
MHVGYMLRTYPRFTQTFVVNEILELEQQGVDISILSLKKPTDGRFHESISRVRGKADYVPEFLVESPAKVARAHWGCMRRSLRSYISAMGPMLRHRTAAHPDFMQAALALRWAKKQRIKHVHVHFGTQEATVALLASMMGDFSYSLTLHAFDIFRDNVDRRLLARKINASRFTVTVSQYNRRFMVENLPGVDPDKIRVLYNGIDLDTFQKNEVSREPNTIMSVGRLIEKKGLVHLIRAVGHLRDRGKKVSCKIVGDGPLKSELKSEVKRLNLRDSVELTGGLSQARVREMLGETACFALPCIQAKDGNVDALPTVLLEAMACGCPCVSTRISGVPEIIDHDKTGFLVEPGDEEPLADAIGRVLDDKELHSSLSDAGRRRAESVFNVRTNVGRINEWFQQAAGVNGQSNGESNAKKSPLNAVECAS